MWTASIVIHNSESYQIERTLNCLLSSEVSKVFLIDNSVGADYKYLASNNPRIKYIKTFNRGFGAGHNIAFKKSIELGSDYHLVLNPDVYWEDDVISPLIKYFNDNPRVGLIAPQLLNPDGSIQYSCRRLPSPLDLLANRFLPDWLVKDRLDKYLLREWDHSKTIKCWYFLGAFLFFRNHVLKECGVFDERFFLYPEDIDITRRIGEKWDTVYCPEVSVYHEHQRASKKNLRLFFIHLNNMIKYFNKWGWIKDFKRKEYNDVLDRSLID